MKTILFAMVIGAQFGSALAAADDRHAKVELPADGTWARYHVVVKKKDAETEHDYKLTMSLVGTHREGNDVFRWVELKFDEGNDSTFIEKYLIPQTAIL